MPEAPRLTHLRDYLRVVREHRLVVALMTVVTAAAAFGLAARQDPTYTARASVSFGSPSQDLELLGSAASGGETAEQRGAINAAVVDRRAVAQRVRERLRSPRSVAELQGMVSGSQQLRTGFVVVTAQSGSAREAARVANAFATEAAAVATEDARERFDRAVDSLRPRLRRLRRSGDEVTASLLQQRVATLETLRDVTEPARVAQRATVPSSPSSPRPVRDGLLGALLGLVLGLIAAFARNSLDVRLRSAEDVREQLDLPVLSQVGEEAMGFAGLVDRRQEEVSAAGFEAFRILRTNLEFLVVDRTPSAVLVTSGLPEEGKSTVAASLAAASAAAGRSTLLVECDLRRPSLSDRLGIDPVPGVTDLVSGQATLEQVRRSVPLRVPGPSLNGSAPSGDADGHTLDVVPAGSSSPLPAELLGSRRFAEFVARVRETYDVVVFDTSPLLPVVDTLELVRHVDAVLLCVRVHRTTRDQAKAARAALEHLPDRPVGLVVTGLRRADEEGYGYYAYGYREPARA